MPASAVNGAITAAVHGVQSTAAQLNDADLPSIQASLYKISQSLSDLVEAFSIVPYLIVFVVFVVRSVERLGSH